MPRQELLTESQRLSLQSPASDERTMVRHYTLSSEDLALKVHSCEPRRSLGLDTTPEKGQPVFEHVYGTLIVESDRMDAALRIDGEDCGNVPRLLSLSPGRHKVFLQAANAPDKTREVEIKVGYRTSVA